jgi:hypothetical protein
MGTVLPLDVTIAAALSLPIPAVPIARNNSIKKALEGALKVCIASQGSRSEKIGVDEIAPDY